MNFEELKQKIDAYVNTNGTGAITGAKLNEILHDIVDTVTDNVQTDTVQVIISAEEKQCSFKWPYDDTNLEDLAFDGYDGVVFVPEYKFPMDGIIISEGYTDPYNPGIVPPSSEYRQGAWVGNLTKLEKGSWYMFTSPLIQSSGMNCIVHIWKNQTIKTQ